MNARLVLAPAALAALPLCAACAATAPDCTLVENGFGPRGEVAIRVERVATGLVVPWGLAFLPGGDVLVTERPGRVRDVEQGPDGALWVTTSNCDGRGTCPAEKDVLVRIVGR